MKISNEISKNFTSVEGRRKIIDLYGDSSSSFFGMNDEKEDVQMSVSKESGIILKTYQKNGYVRCNYYDKNGYLEGTSYEGRWDIDVISR